MVCTIPLGVLLLLGGILVHKPREPGHEVVPQNGMPIRSWFETPCGQWGLGFATGGGVVYTEKRKVRSTTMGCWSNEIDFSEIKIEDFTARNCHPQAYHLRENHPGMGSGMLLGIGTIQAWLQCNCRLEVDWKSCRYFEEEKLEVERSRSQ